MRITVTVHLILDSAIAHSLTAFRRERIRRAIKCTATVIPGLRACPEADRHVHRVGGGNWGISLTVGGGPAVGWFPLGYGEPYLPPYGASRNYFRNVNVSNTRITNITNVTNNYYNTTNINRNNVNSNNTTTITKLSSVSGIPV